MTPQPTNNETAGAEGRLNVLNIIWICFLTSSALFIFLSEFTKPEDAAVDQGGTSPILLALCALAVSSVAASFFIKGLFLKKSAESRNANVAQQAYILAFALAETATLFGLMARFLVVTNYHYFLFALALVALLLHKPRREDFTHASTFGARG